MVVQGEGPLNEVLDGVTPSRGLGCDHLCHEVVVVPGGCVPLLLLNRVG